MRSFIRSIPARTVLILLAITIVWTLLEHVLGFNTSRHDIGQYTRMAMPFFFYIGIGIAVMKKRRQQGNRLGFSEGFRTGMAVTVFFSLLSTLWLALYAEVINPDYKPTLLAFEKQKLLASGATPGEVDNALAQADSMSGGSVTSYVYLFVFMFIAGVIVSLLAALVMRKTRTEPSNNHGI
jgi:hypothetical protein